LISVLPKFSGADQDIIAQAITDGKLGSETTVKEFSRLFSDWGRYECYISDSKNAREVSDSLRPLITNEMAEVVFKYITPALPTGA